VIRIDTFRFRRTAHVAGIVAMAAVLVAAPRAPLQAQACAHCGSERWAVKTLSDRDRAKVDPSPVLTTIGTLGALAMPRHRPEDQRIAPTELTTYRIRAVIVGWKGESDQDFHLVVANPQNPLETMIVEVPSPGCAGVCTSGKVREMTRVRQTVLDHLGRVPNGRLTCLDPEPRVTVTGVGFFDRPHSQNGRAPNAIELHPVLDLTFDDAAIQPHRVSCRTGAPREGSPRTDTRRPRRARAVVPANEADRGLTAPEEAAPQDTLHPAGATARCRDGTLSYSAHHSGTCSHHGGVARWF
jgi:hypothetical protein